MPTTVALVSGAWKRAVLAEHEAWRRAVDDGKEPELTGAIGAVLLRHREVLDGFRRPTVFTKTLINRAIDDTLEGLRRRDGLADLTGNTAIEDDLATDLRDALTGALDTRLAHVPVAVGQRDQVRITLRTMGDHLRDELVELTEVSGGADVSRVIDGEVRRFADNRIDDRINRRILAPDEVDLVSAELAETLALVCTFTLITGTPDGRERLDRWRSEVAADPAPARAWADFDGSSTVPPGGSQDPELDTTSRNAHIRRNAVEQAEAVLTPRQGRDQIPLPDWLSELDAGLVTIAGTVLREELHRERFPFDLSRPELRRGAILAMALLTARQFPDRLLDAVDAAQRHSGPATSERMAKAAVRRVLGDVGLVGVWDLAVITAAVQRNADIPLAADGWNDELARAVFGQVPGGAGLRRALTPAEVLPIAPDGTPQPIRAAGVRLQRQAMYRAARQQSIGLDHPRWEEAERLREGAADQVFEWLVGTLTRRDRQAAVGAPLPPGQVPPDGRWAVAEIDRWMAGDLLRNKITNAGKPARRESPRDTPELTARAEAEHARAEPQIDETTLDRTDLERIQARFREPTRYWMRRLEAAGRVSDPRNVADPDDLRSWAGSLSPETRQAMHVVSRWERANPGVTPPRSEPAGFIDTAALTRGSANRKLPPLSDLQARRALVNLLDLLPWRAAQEFAIPEVSNGWKMRGQRGTLRGSAVAYFRSERSEHASRNLQRWSFEMFRMLALLDLNRANHIHTDTDTDTDNSALT